MESLKQETAYKRIIIVKRRSARNMKIVFGAKRLKELNELLMDYEKTYGSITPDDGEGVTAMCCNCMSSGCGRSGDCRSGYSK